MNRSQTAPGRGSIAPAALGLLVILSGCSALTSNRFDRQTPTVSGTNNVDDAPVATVEEGPAQAPRRLPPGEVIRASLFDAASSDAWTPLYGSNFFTDGWDEPFVFSPASDSGALETGVDQCGERSVLSPVGRRLFLPRPRWFQGEPGRRFLVHLRPAEPSPRDSVHGSVSGLRTNRQPTERAPRVRTAPRWGT